MLRRFLFRVAPLGVLGTGLLCASTTAAPQTAVYDPDLSATAVNLRGSAVPVIDFEVTELAGNSLSVYPHFEYVKAFNTNSPVSFALDPTLFPASAGATVDVYIVTSRSEADWLADRTLTDVRGTPDTETLGTTTIQSSRFILSNSALLNGDAGIGLGVPYDLVCDTNRNGLLDLGDYIDGFGDEAGFYVVHDLTQPGPLPVTQTTYSATPGTVSIGFENERIFYPTNIGQMGRLPLIVVSHGNGHQYVWYDHIGLHMASYGYVVMSHQNNTVPGVQTAATTTLEHTDAFLDQLGLINGGVLVNHVDSDRITWIGHSRGGEGVAIAYDRIFDGAWTPVNYEIDDILLVSSIAPVDFVGPSDTDPHGVAYSLWTGGSDSDVNGCASSDVVQTFHLHDRAERWRQSISLHGVGHGDFHNGSGGAFATGPCLVGRTDTHRIMRGYLLPLVKHYVENNVPARDYLWRQWESFQPRGAPTTNGCVTVDLQFREDPDEVFLIDDYQTQTSTSTSSSGGAVSFTVSNLSEGRLDDANANFTNNVGDVMNGMTAAGAADTSRGIVFQWNGDSFYEQEIVPKARDLTDDVYLSFRACQATRHPNTTAVLADLTFTVTLIDGSATTSSINIGAYGGGIEEPYQRINCGSGAGWANEFETIRIRLTDFTHNGSGLDLSDVAAVRFEFGPSFGAASGRIGMDEIAITRDAEPPRAGALSITLLDSLEILPPSQTISIKVRIDATSEALIAGSPQMHYRFDSGSFTTVPLAPASLPGLFAGNLPGAACADEIDIFFSAEGSLSGVVTLPSTAPADVFEPLVGQVLTNFSDDFESDLGWTTEVLNGATSGAWERGVPVDDPGWEHDPPADGDGSGSCYLTQNAAGNTDVDAGAVRLTSPTLDLSGSAISIQYLYYLKLTGDGDQLLVEYNGNDGVGAWVTLESHTTSGGSSWRSNTITAADIVAAGGTVSSAARVRFTANDGDPQSIVEAGIDGFTINDTVCNEGEAK